MKEFNIRCGIPDDAEGIFNVMAKAFRVEENSRKWHSWKNLATKRTTQFRVLEIDDKIISVALISPQRLRVGKSCEIIKGDVGEVSTLPEFQGRGYGSELMRDVVEWMRENEYDMSRLGGYAGFYSRFGYVPFPRRFVEFSLESVKAGASTISAEEMYRPPEGLPGIVRSYDADRDSRRRNELYHIFNGERSGAIVKDFNPISFHQRLQTPSKPPKSVKAPAKPSISDPFRLVYEVDNLVEGYLFATDYGRDVTPFEAHITIGDIAFNPERPDALEGLMKQILHFACNRGIKRVTARLPFDTGVLSALTQAKITFKLEELQGAYATNMIQIINLKSLFRKICPELKARLRASDLTLKETYRVEIGFENQRVGLCVNNANVNISSVESANVQLLTDQATLMKLMFGIISFEEAVIANSDKLDAFGSAILSAWFPRQACASGPWG